MANRKLPRNVVEMRGTDRPDRTNYQEPDPLPIEGTPEPPIKLRAAAKKEWNRAIQFLTERKLIGLENLSLLALYCDLFAGAVEDRAKGLKVEAATITQIRLLAGEFFLTPASRAKAKAGNASEKDSEENRFFGA